MPLHGYFPLPIVITIPSLDLPMNNFVPPSINEQLQTPISISGATRYVLLETITSTTVPTTRYHLRTPFVVSTITSYTYLTPSYYLLISSFPSFLPPPPPPILASSVFFLPPPSNIPDHMSDVFGGIYGVYHLAKKSFIYGGVFIVAVRCWHKHA